MTKLFNLNGLLLKLDKTTFAGIVGFVAGAAGVAAAAAVLVTLA